MRKLTLSIVSCLSNSYIVMIIICSAEKLADVSLSWWSCSHFMMAEAIKRCDPRMKEQYWIPWSQMWIMPRKIIRKILSCHSSWKMSKICQRLYLTNVLRQENSIEVNRCALSIISRFQMLFIHQGIKTTICVKNPSVDRFVSGGILSSGAWEPSIVTQVMRAVDTYPGAVFLDIGANIGEDTGLFYITPFRNFNDEFWCRSY